MEGEAGELRGNKDLIVQVEAAADNLLGGGGGDAAEEYFGQLVRDGVRQVSASQGVTEARGAWGEVGSGAPLWLEQVREVDIGWILDGR